MSVSCEECGKLYHKPPEKLTKINDEISSFTCSVCDYEITVVSSGTEIGKIEKSVKKPSKPTASATTKKQPVSTQSSSAIQPAAQHVAEIEIKGMGLRSKMLLLFLCVPLILMAGSGFFSYKQMNSLASKINADSIKVIIQVAEEKIVEKARSVALQCRIHLWSHPDLNKGDFNRDNNFKKIAVQKVGVSGYTVLIEKARNKQWNIWAADSKLAEFKGDSSLKQVLGNNYEPFSKVLDGLKNSKETSGYYSWEDKDKKMNKKFVAVTLVEGTPYYIAAIAYMDDFTGEIVDNMKKHTKVINQDITIINFGILLISLIILGFSITIYAYRLTKNIKYLTSAADRISIGELDTVIEITSTDEIGSLSEAISRMQDSLRFSLERLRSV
jgi:methyl-accepting chemotaxis protein